MKCGHGKGYLAARAAARGAARTHGGSHFELCKEPFMDRSPPDSLAEPAPRALKDLPGPRPWPVLGNLPQLDLPRMHEKLEGWAEQYGPLYRLTLGGRPIVVL